MASEDKYKEGVDFVWIDKGGYKTRKFLSSAEKAAKNAPDKPAVAKPQAKAKGFSVDMASKAIDKAVGPKPMKRPAVATSKDAPMQTSPRPPKKPTELVSTSPVVTPKITTTKLAPVATTKVASRVGHIAGKPAGMPQAKKVEAATGGSNSTIVKYLKENNLDKKGVSLTDILAVAIPAGITAAVAKVGYDKLKKDRAMDARSDNKLKATADRINAQSKATPTKPSPTTTKASISEATPLKSTASKPEGSKAKTPTTPKALPAKLNYQDRISRDIKVRADTVARATKANAAADETIKAKAANVARVKAEAKARSAAASKISADKAARIARAKAVTDKADAAAKARRDNVAKVKAKAAARGAAARGGSTDLTRGVGTGGFGGLSNAAIERALNPLNLAKGGLITKKKK